VVKVNISETLCMVIDLAAWGDTEGALENKADFTAKASACWSLPDGQETVKRLLAVIGESDLGKPVDSWKAALTYCKNLVMYPERYNIPDSELKIRNMATVDGRKRIRAEYHDALAQRDKAVAKANQDARERISEIRLLRDKFVADWDAYIAEKKKEYITHS
jgi:hypothetical protein